MSMRRPRIKATAILPPKRSARESVGAATAPKQPKTDVKSEVTKPNTDIESNKPEEKVPPNKLKPSDKPAIPSDNEPADKNTTSTKSNVDEVVPIVPENIDLNDNDVFKSPPVVSNHKRTESFSASDFDGERIDESVIKGCYGPPSPVKVRQRIRPTPFFGMRRNSTQGYGSDMEDEPRRQRHTSTSSNTGSSTPQRMRPFNLQRIRTESSCSNFSEYSKDQNPKVTRKVNSSDDHFRGHAARKDFVARFNAKFPQNKATMKMSDLIYYNPTTNLMVASEPPKPLSEEKPAEELSIIAPPEEENGKEGENETSMPVPQLKLGPDGEMILDEQSLVIETTAGKEARVTLANTKVIYMDEFSGNSGFYRRSKRTKDWTSDETIKFYRCLHTVGTDFSLMLTLFPNRSRKDLKLKFKKEERNNSNLINKALLFPKTFNVAELKQELDKEQQELDAKKKELEEINTQINEKKNKLKSNSRKYCGSRSSHTLKDGDIIYAQESVDGKNGKTKSKNKAANEATDEYNKEAKSSVEEVKAIITDIKAEKKAKRQRKQTFNIHKSCIKEEEPILVVVPPDDMLGNPKIDLDAASEPIELPPFDTIVPTGTKNESNVTDENCMIVYEAEDQMDDGNEILYEIIAEVPSTPSKLKNYTIIECSDLNSGSYIISNHKLILKDHPNNESIERTSEVDSVENTSDATIHEVKSKMPQPNMETASAETDTPLRSPEIPNECFSKIGQSEEDKNIEYVEIIHMKSDDNDYGDEQTELEVENISNTENDIVSKAGEECYVTADINEHCDESTDSSGLKETENRNKIKKEFSIVSEPIFGANLKVENKAEENELNANQKEETNFDVAKKNATKFRKLKPIPRVANTKRSKNTLKNAETVSDHESIPISTTEQLKDQEVLESSEEINDSAQSVSIKNESTVPNPPLNAVDILTEIECFNELSETGTAFGGKFENDGEDDFDDETDYDVYNDDNTYSPVKGQIDEDVYEDFYNVTETSPQETLKPENDAGIEDQDDFVGANDANPDEQIDVDNNEDKTEESFKDIDDEMERFMINDLGAILTNLINGTLVVVASEDENDPDKIVNEIYVMNKETGTLSDTPLDLPEDVVNCIVEELNAT